MSLHNVTTLQNEGFFISTDKNILDISTIHNFLTNAYWSKGISKETIEKIIKHTLCFGVYYKNKQVGFARITTDYVAFAYLADVFILEEYRGKGLSKWLIDTILNYQPLKEIKRWMLATLDAQGLYTQFGFKPLTQPEKYLERLTY